MATAMDVLDYDCPRCHRPVSEDYYGPCGACVIELRANMRIDAEVIATADYVPKMNVTPNAVATKD